MFRRKRRVVMLVSVGKHAAGEKYRLPPDVADSYIAKGYAEGELSRPYDEDELKALRSTMQIVSFS
jgi:hypothetical protein